MDKQKKNEKLYSGTDASFLKLLLYKYGESTI